jgi:hypothetical protein
MSAPTKDSLLAPYSTNFNSVLVASGVSTYHVTSGQVTQYTTLHTAYLNAWNAVLAARDQKTFSSQLAATKNAAKAALLPFLRQIYKTVQADGTISDANKIALGVHIINNTPSPVPPPSEAPSIDILSTTGNTVRIRLHQADETQRGKPAGVSGAAIYSFVGATAPTEESEWNFEGITGKTQQDVTFTGAPAGAKVWFTAFWFNNRKQNGPAAAPVGCNIPGNAAMAA